MLQMRRIQIFLLFYFYSFNIVFEGMPPAAFTSSLTINISKQVNSSLQSLTSLQRLVAWDRLGSSALSVVHGNSSAPPSYFSNDGENRGTGLKELTG